MTYKYNVCKIKVNGREKDCLSFIWKNGKGYFCERVAGLGIADLNIFEIEQIDGEFKTVKWIYNGDVAGNQETEFAENGKK